jgi:Tol biopolymer transport system component
MGVGGALLGLLLAGCGPAVRQDRTITWSAEGKAVGFQHNEEGVFVADKEGGTLEKIFQPGPDVLVASAPLWSPTDRRLIFTTARDPNPPPTPQFLARLESDPVGDIYRQRPIEYTCWLRAAPGAGQAPKPAVLFTAACDHPGYVAANLAVRWHPQGDRILYVKQTGPKQHGLFVFDLATQSSAPIFPQTAEALLFDWTPDGSQLVCVLGNSDPSATNSGIWIGKPDANSWWHVPQSAALSEAPLGSVLEQLRATRPAWTADGKRFAFVSYSAAAVAGQPGLYFLRQGTLATQKVEKLAQAATALSDLHWSPDGARLGVVRGADDGTLHLVEPAGLSEPINRRSVRRFAGWNATGSKLAYIVPDQVPPPESERLALLLPPEAQARDAVYVAAGNGKEPGQVVFSGMRVSAPHWSPKEDKLSLWFTFCPTHRSLLSHLLGWSLPPGDPAAIFDVPTSKISWMAVNAFEKAQIGHYHLLKRDYAEAWRWYQEAEAALPAPEAPLAPIEAFFSFVSRRDFTLFEYYCLSKLGRPVEAKDKLERFRRAFVTPFDPAAPAPGQPARKDEAPVGGQLVADDRAHFLAMLLRGMYATEVFLSLDAAEDGQDFLRRELAAVKADTERLAIAIALGQMLLVEKKHEEYADLATATIRPLRQKLGGPLATDPNLFANLDLEWTGDVALLPMYAPEFVSTLSNDHIRAILPRWIKMRDQGSDDGSRLTADLFLVAAYGKLARQKQQQAIDARIQANPARAQYLAKGVKGWLEDMRQLPAQIEAMRQVFSGKQ